ncbi:MAG: HAD family hydrolase [Sphaerochaetaceae bacterium]|jgi:putative hydrolase of the HAD superfamily|nr:HAD family hydrolase [Sphaerochaetaceae bacterium]MDD3940846.1 HAD family hydrolase [Sphaerochaetaceae bacterium]MDX9939468.1 HAD family hydrolase [Sphaerochaetaceae bacterium]
MKIQVVCFDIDGTLYPKWVTDWKLVRSFFPSPALALRYQRFRQEVRKEEGVLTVPQNEQGFRRRQAEWIAGEGKSDACIERICDRIERQFYASWRKSFAHLTPFPLVRTVLEELKRRGVVVAALSDFPIEGKLKALGVEDLVDFSACTEQSGYLKPHPAPFHLVCDVLKVDPAHVLYVGDSCRKDMVGAARVGMRSCLIAPKAKDPSKRSRLHQECPEANAICADYVEFHQRIEELLA